MTILEAIDRARLIWGFEPMKVHMSSDGSADIDYGYADAPPFGSHKLDANGHAVCHHQCAEQEKRS